jgi:hypothetical protein
MKKLLYILLPALLLAGCSDWLDVNESPNNPTDVPVELVLPAAENAIATRLGGTIFNYCGFFAQYWDQSPVANQYNTEADYSFLNSLFDNDYSVLYAYALEDLEVVRTKSEEAGEYGNYFAATVLRVYAYQLIVDLIDQAPYSEALRGSEIPMPRWDSGEAIYDGLLAELSAARGLLGSESFVSSSDLLLGGDLDQWSGFANALELKLLMRSSYAKDNSSRIMSLVNGGEFFAGDISFHSYVDEAGKRNPWYETNTIGLGTVNNIAAYPIISYLESLSDPRLPVYFSAASGSNEYAGAIPGGKSVFFDAVNADYSLPRIFERNAANATRPVYFFTQSELLFFIAEAKLRFGNDDNGAREAYEAAIDASFALNGLSDGAAIYGSGRGAAWSSGDLESKLARIMLQKWVSLFGVNHCESWCEIRRLGYPALSGARGTEIAANSSIYTPGNLISPVVNELGFGNLLQRLPFPEEATTLNKNTPSQAGKGAKIWWDRK